MRRAFALLWLLFLAAGSARAAAPQPPPAPQRWVVISDVHFNPFADPKIAQRLIDEPVDRWREIFASDRPQPFADYGSDTNDALFESALDAIHNEAADATVVFVTGDFLAHDFRTHFDRVSKAHDDATYDATVDKTIAFLATEFREAFPRAQFLPVIGNIDGYCGDYASTPGSPFLARMASYWAPAVSADPSGWMSQFATGGYYTVSLPAGSARAIVLNDVFWSAGYKNACGDAHADPGGDELTWLSQTLKVSQTSPVWVVAHIPPGVDAFSTMHRRDPGTPVMFLADRFDAAFVSALTSTPTIAMSLSGHTHTGSYRILGPNPSTPVVPMLVVPSISPIFGNSPAFTVLDVDATSAQVLDQSVYALDNLNVLAKDGRRNAVWRRDFDFTGVYGRGAIDAARLWSSQMAVFADERSHHRDGTWRANWCAVVALTATDYDACANPQIQTQLPPHPPPPPTPSPTPNVTPSPAPSSAPSPTPSP